MKGDGSPVGGFMGMAVQGCPPWRLQGCAGYGTGYSWLCMIEGYEGLLAMAIRGGKED